MRTDKLLAYVQVATLATATYSADRRSFNDTGSNNSTNILTFSPPSSSDSTDSSSSSTIANSTALASTRSKNSTFTTDDATSSTAGADFLAASQQTTTTTSSSATAASDLQVASLTTQTITSTYTTTDYITVDLTTTDYVTSTVYVVTVTDYLTLYDEVSASATSTSASVSPTTTSTSASATADLEVASLTTQTVTSTYTTTDYITVDLTTTDYVSSTVYVVTVTDYVTLYDEVAASATTTSASVSSTTTSTSASATITSASATSLAAASKLEVLSPTVKTVTALSTVTDYVTIDLTTTDYVSSTVYVVTVTDYVTDYVTVTLSALELGSQTSSAAGGAACTGKTTVITLPYSLSPSASSTPGASSTSATTTGPATTSSGSSSAEVTFCPDYNGKIYTDAQGDAQVIYCDTGLNGTVIGPVSINATAPFSNITAPANSTLGYNATMTSLLKSAATSASLATCIEECNAMSACVGTVYSGGNCTYYSSLRSTYADAGVEAARLVVVSKSTSTKKTTSKKTSTTLATSTSSSSIKSSSTCSTVTPPAPTQTGIVSGCTEWYVAKSGDYCYLIAEKYGISVSDFEAWNPAVNPPSCNNVQIGDAYCVAVGCSASATSSTLTSSTASSTSTTSSSTSTSTVIPYVQYNGNGTVAAGWPSMADWLDFETLWTYNAPIMAESCEDSWDVPNDSADEIAGIKAAIQDIGTASGVDVRFILAIMMEESDGCVRVPTTYGSVANPGLMQDHDGNGTCNSNGTVQTPCPESEIYQMIEDGTAGTSSGDGLVQCIAETDVTDVSKYYRAARIYNGGLTAYNATDLGTGCCNLCYSSDIANRLVGWHTGTSGCTL